MINSFTVQSMKKYI